MLTVGELRKTLDGLNPNANVMIKEYNDIDGDYVNKGVLTIIVGKNLCENIHKGETRETLILSTETGVM
jgi:hypothetical protein